MGHGSWGGPISDMDCQVLLTCDWIVQRPKRPDIIEWVEHVLAELDCTLWMMDAKQDARGVYVRECIWCVPSRATLDVCLERLKPHFHFSECSRTDGSQLTKKPWFRYPAHWYGVDTSSDEIDGQRNEAVLYGQPMWAECVWLIKPIEPAHLDSLFDLLDDKPYSLRFADEKELTPPFRDKPPYYLSFVAKIGPTQRLPQFRDELWPYFDLQDWHWMLEESTFLHGPVLPPIYSLMELFSMTPFSREHKEAFLHLTNKYGPLNEAR